MFEHSGPYSQSDFKLRLTKNTVETIFKLTIKSIGLCKSEKLIGAKIRYEYNLKHVFM